jgi:probable phosphoglycerate mutase
VSNIAKPHPRSPRSLLLSLLFVLALPYSGEAQATDILRIYVARHGQTDWNVEGRLQGGTDIPLNATGRQQAIELAQRLKGVHLDAIYSSTLKRSRETAEVVGGSTRLTSVPGLNERRLGRFEGRKLARSTTRGASNGGAASDDPLTREYDRRLIDPKDALDGGESLEDFGARVSQATTDLLARHHSGSILIVGHSMTNQMILKALLDLTLEQASGIQISNDELYLVELGGGVAPRLWKRVTATNLGDL